MAMSSMGGSEAANVSSFFKQPADSYGNDEGLEMKWAMKAFYHAEVYFNLITAVDPKFLKLTQLDDEIYEKFKVEFPDTKVDVIDEDKMKSKEGKQEWRNFCNFFKGKIEDFNMGTLLRVDCKEDVSEKNTTLVPRIQFLAIEIARNRQGLNSELREKFSKNKTSTGSEAPKPDSKKTDESKNTDDTDTSQSGTQS